MTPRDAEWMTFANCAGVNPELFFPERGANADNHAAKKVCHGCVVRSECLQYALDNNERLGIWGGLSERQRRRIRLGEEGARLSTCTHCAKEFVATSSEKLCSPKCRAESRRAGQRRRYAEREAS